MFLRLPFNGPASIVRLTTVAVLSTLITTAAAPASAATAGAEVSVISGGAALADGSAVSETSTITIGTSALLSPGVSDRVLQTNIETATPYETASAVAPEGWTIQWSTNGSTWLNSEPAAATVRSIRATATGAAAGPISGHSQVYSSETRASIPSTNFSASTGGDGWDVFFSDENVYNIFHHDTGVLRLDCHVRATGDRCTTTDPTKAYSVSFSDYYGVGQPTGWVDPVSGRLYAMTTKGSTGRAGVLCVNVSLAAGPESCGFTGLSSTAVTAAWEYTSGTAVIGRRMYAMNSSSKELLCFDAATVAPCAGSPISLADISSAARGNGGNAAYNRIKSAGSRLWVKTPNRIRCFTSALAVCAGFPDSVTVVADSDLPIAVHTTASGTPDGLCFHSTALTADTPTQQSCINTSGSLVPSWHSPFNNPDGTQGEWNSNNEDWWYDGDTTLGRHYWTTVGLTGVNCFDYATNNSCAGFSTYNDGSLGLTYSVRVDPQNPACLWVNSNSGLIRTFDAYSGSAGCTGHPVITLQPSQFAPRYACSTDAGISEWTTLKLVSLVGGGTADTVTLTVRDALGNIVTGWKDVPVTLGASLDMTGLDVALSGSRPTFSFSFSGITGSLTTAVIALDYKGAGPELCIRTTLKASAVMPSSTCPSVSYNGTLTDDGGSFAVSRTIKIDTTGSACGAGIVVQTVPETVTALTGSGLNTTATLRFSPPLNTGGLPLLGFVYSTNAGGTWSDANAVDNGDGTYGFSLTGLSPGSTYTILVAATNSKGRGPSASISVTVQRVSMSTLVDVTLNTGTVALESTTATGLPLTYTVETSTACSVSGTTVTLLATGLCRLVAYQAGDPTATPIVLPATTRGSFTVLPNPIVVPSAVETLTVTTGNSQLSLAWFVPQSDGGGAITDYQIQYKSGASWIPLVDGVSTRTSAVITGLTNGTAYDVRVAAVNSAGQGPWTATVTGTPKAVPGAVTNLVATRTAGATTASLTFSAPANTGGSALTDYSVQIKDRASATWTTFADGTSTSTTISVTGLTGSTDYDFRVAAVNAVGSSPWTSTATLSATPAASALALSWTAPTFTGGETLTGYVVEYRLETAIPWDTVTAGVSETYTLSGLTNGSSYEVRVAALTSTGTSSYSSMITATPVATPGVPQSLTLTPGARQISLTWTAPSDNGGSAVTDYTITYKLSSAGSWTTLSDGVSTATAAVITGLTNGSSYDVRVAAVNAQGTGPATVAGSTTPRTTPDAPAGRIALGGKRKLQFSWVPPVGNGGAAVTAYQVQYKRATDVAWTTDPTAYAGTSAIITVDYDETTYSLRVAAVNAAGTGAYTSTASATTALACSIGVLTFDADGAGQVNVDNPNRCYERQASVGVDRNGNVLGAKLTLPANSVNAATLIDIVVIADATSIAAGLPSVRVTATESGTAQAVTTFAEPIEIELVGDPSALPSISTDGGITWRRLQQRTSAEVKALGATGDGYSVSGSTFTIYSMHLTEFGLFSAPSPAQNASAAYSSTLPMLPKDDAVLTFSVDRKTAICVSPQWSQTPEHVTFHWVGLTVPDTVLTTGPLSSSITIGAADLAGIHCEVSAFANHAVGTVRANRMFLTSETKPTGTPTTTPRSTTRQVLLQFPDNAKTLTAAQRLRLRTALGSTSIAIVAGASGRGARALAQQRLANVVAFLRNSGYTGGITSKVKLGTSNVTLTATTTR